MRRRQFFALGLGVAACAVGCGTARGAGSPVSTLGRISVASGGESWVPVAQALARTLRQSGFDVGGAGRTAAFAGSAGIAGTATRLTISGLPALAAAEINEGVPVLDSATPLARLVGDIEVIVVPTGSRYTHFDDLATRLVADPAHVMLAGGPQGEADHLLFGTISQGLGADTRLIDYAGYPGSVEAATALLGGKAGVAAGPLAEWRSKIDKGRVRVLAVSSAERVPGLDAPTLIECGVRVDFADWAAVLGPKGMGGAQRAEAIEMIDRVSGSDHWLDACRTSGWTPLPLSGDGFGTWLASETERTRMVLRDLGLLNTPDTTCWGACENGH